MGRRLRGPALHGKRAQRPTLCRGASYAAILSSYAVILGLDPRIEGNGALILANVAQAGSSILGSRG